MDTIIIYKYVKKAAKFIIKKTKKTCEICNIILKETEIKFSICHCSMMLKMYIGIVNT